MLVLAALVLMVLWMLGLVVFKTAGGVIHLLLVVALVLFCIRFI